MTATIVSVAAVKYLPGRLEKKRLAAGYHKHDQGGRNHRFQKPDGAELFHRNIQQQQQTEGHKIEQRTDEAESNPGHVLQAQLLTERGLDQTIIVGLCI